MNKTPVSILQEMMVKKGAIPNFELIYNGGGTHQNIFTFQVSCEGLKASGTGRCKKDAKHEAAKAMLELIAKQNALPQLPASPCESPVRTPLPVTLPVCPKSPANVPFRNTIGELQDLCSINNLEDPQYKETGNIGPAHAKVFTVQCLVSTFVEEGTATTKKQAKHEAARKMINRIMGVVVDGQLNLKNNLKDHEYTREQIQSKIAIARYPNLSMLQEPIKSKVNWGIRIQNYYESFKQKFNEESKTELLGNLEEILAMTQQLESNFYQHIFLLLNTKFENILKSIEIQFFYKTFKTNSKADNKIFTFGIFLNTAPDIVEIGLGKTENEAVVDAIKNVTESMQFLLQ